MGQHQVSSRGSVRELFSETRKRGGNVGCAGDRTGGLGAGKSVVLRARALGRVQSYAVLPVAV